MHRTRDPGAQEEWDPVLVPLMKLLQSKKGMKTKQAVEVGKRKVTYFRGKDCNKWFTTHGELAKKKCGKAFAAYVEGKEEGSEMKELITALVQKGFLYPTKYRPIEGAREDKPKRWPDRLAAVPPSASPNGPFDVEYCYVIAYEGNKNLQYVLLGCVIFAILLACMFPAWPMWAKLGVWYCVTALLVLLILICIVRLIVYLVGWVVGVDFWIFPNFFDECAGLVESFLPFYTFERRKDGYRDILLRAVIGGMLAGAMQQISLESAFDDLYDFGKMAVLDFVAWGEDHLLALPEASRVPTLEQLKVELENDPDIFDDDEDAETLAGAADADTRAGDEAETLKAEA